MVAAILFPVIVIGVFHEKVPSLVIFSILIAILVLLTHQKNIERLLRKEESKANIIKKKKPKAISKQESTTGS
jgi:glycerol-3-phosphate acyltransferase PlsY